MKTKLIILLALSWTMLVSAQTFLAGTNALAQGNWWGADTNFTGVNGLTGLTAAPTLNTRGLLFYEQTSGATVSGGSWVAPTWVLQARQVHQLPN